MCIATVYIDDGKQTEVIMQDVTSVESTQDGLLITNILGEDKLLRASIKNIDFVKHSVALTPDKNSVH